MKKSTESRQKSLQEKLQNLFPGKTTLRAKHEEEKEALQNLVDEVCEDLKAKGIEPKAHTIREYLGTGSNTTYQAYLHKWRNRHEQIQQREMSTAVLAAFANEVRRYEALATENLRKTNNVLEAENCQFRDALEERNREIEHLTAERDEARELERKTSEQKAVYDAEILKLEKEKELLNDAKEDLLMRVAVADAKVEDVVSAMEVFENQKDELFQDNATLENEVRSLKQELSKIQKKLSNLNEKFTVECAAHAGTKKELISAEVTSRLHEENSQRDRADLKETRAALAGEREKVQDELNRLVSVEKDYIRHFENSLEPNYEAVNTFAKLIGSAISANQKQEVSGE